MKQEIRGNLARLLATENLTVLHRKNIDTAMFDAVNRVLSLPDWETSDLIYEMLIGHETAHAIYTPHVDPSKISELPADFVNVVEDVRIEKRMKDRYPGMRRTFYDGYKKLHDDDFFELNDTDVNELNFLDRVNIYFKIGSHLHLDFNEEEKEIINKIATVNEFDEVVPLARLIYEYCKQNNQLPPTKSSGKCELVESGDGDGDGDGDARISVSSCDGSISSSGGNASNSDNSSQSDQDGKNSGSPGMNAPSSGGNGQMARTMNSFDRNIKKMVNKYPDDIVYVKLPKLTTKDCIIPIDDVHRSIGIFVGQIKGSNLADSNNEYLKFKNESKKDVGYLVKEFESKKAADSYSRIQENKTGVLDTCVLHTYKYNDDLFKKNTFVPEGKNHGLIFILDWSGSMGNTILNTYKQLYKLVLFCQRVSIPFDVYAFTSEWRSTSSDHVVAVNNRNWEKNAPDNTININPHSFGLMHLLSSSLSFSKLNTYMHNLYLLAMYLDNKGRSTLGGYYREFNHKLSLGGTPLNESVVALKEIIREFKQKTKVQKTNCVILTDGEGSVPTVISNSKLYNRDDLSKKYWLLDEKLKTTYHFPNYTGGNWHEFTNIFLQNVKDCFTDVNFISFRLLESREFARFTHIIDDSQRNKVKRELTENRSCSVKHPVYDSYFVLMNDSLASKLIDTDTNSHLKTLGLIRKANTKIMSEFISTIA